MRHECLLRRPSYPGKLLHLVLNRSFRGQTLDRASTVEAVNALAVVDNERCVFGLGNWSAVTQNNDVIADRFRSMHDSINQRDALVQSLGRLGAD